MTKLIDPPPSVEIFSIMELYRPKSLNMSLELHEVITEAEFIPVVAVEHKGLHQAF
jgi:hypothetical protein